MINEYQSFRFKKEIQVALLGKNSNDSWQDIAIQQLQKRCDYLISNRDMQNGESKYNLI
jgi:hypothetical protein